ncbi:MAG: glycosyltransferase family 2 protein [Planctomycetes bacterium]|nr:glycosyltransferase family 2 protein [Planctomycetota bacterium]
MVATSAALVLLVLATTACLGYFVFTLAGLLPRRARLPLAPTHSFAILIPAHNEETGLPATLRSITELDYPEKLLRVWVVADNCTDGTASVPRAFGMRCIKRHDAEKRGKGYAVAFGLQSLLPDLPDIVLILDADCQLNALALRAMDAVFAAGADVVQAAVRSHNADDGPTGYVAAVGAAVDEAIAAGMDRFGQSVPLRGTGMAFRRHVLERVPWTAFGLVEDAEYSRQLQGAGVRVRHCRDAIVSSDSPSSWKVMGRQRRRWRTAGLLTSKPLGLALIAAAAAVAFACRFVWWPASLLLVTAAVYGRAAASVGLSWRRVGLLLKSPLVVLRLACVTLAGLVQKKPTTWQRTPRPGETGRRAA